MKILLVNDYGTPTGGAEISVLLLREELAKRGHDVKLFTGSARVLGQTPESDYVCFGTTGRLRTYLQTSNPSAYFRLKKLLREWQPDVVHVSLFLTQLSPAILPLMENIPALCHLHWYRDICLTGNKHLPDGSHCEFDYGVQCLKHKCVPLHQWLFLMQQMKYLEKHRKVFRRVVANSQFVKSKFEKAGYKDVEVIWCGVKESPNDILPALSSQPTLVFAGRLIAEKGVALLLKAFVKVLQKISTASLRIAGDGAEKENLQHLAARLGIASQVQFVGNIAPERLACDFSSAWVQIVPSLLQETFGLTVAEAMQRGTPVVATRAGGMSELISDAETGLLVNPDENELSAAVLRIIEDETLRTRLRQNAFKFARANLTVARCADEFLRVYREIVD